MKFKRLWWISGGIIFLIVLIAAINLKNENEKLEVQVSTVMKKRLDMTILGSGKIAPLQQSEIYLDETKGELGPVKVNEGQVVQKGEELFRYQNDELTLQAQQYEIEKQRILLHLEKQKKRIDQLNEKMKKQKGKMPKEMVNQLKEEINDLEFQNRESNLNYRDTVIQMENNKIQQEKMIERSPIDGVVKQINENAGFRDSPQLFIYIISEDAYSIEGTVTEYDLHFLKEGQHIKVIPKALPNKVFHGKIEKIGDTPIKEIEDTNANSEGVTSYPFTATLDEEVNDLHNGYHVSIEIDVKAKEKSLVVPAESIKTEEGKTFVYTVNDGIVKKKEVVIGGTDGEWKVIMNGLKEGDIVVIDHLEELSNNMEVKVNKNS